MLLINFFKKASCLLICKKKSELMLFLFSKTSQFIIVSSFFLNSSYAINTLSVDNLDSFQLRIVNANQQINVQDSYFSIYFIIGLILIISLVVISVVSLKKINNQNHKKIVELNEVVLNKNNELIRQHQKIELYSYLFKSLDFRLSRIKESINSLYTEFSMNDSKWKSEIDKIRAFAKEMELLYLKSRAIIKKP